MQRLVKKYPTTIQPSGLEVGEETNLRARIKYIATFMINGDASPGFPLSELACENKMLVEGYYGLLEDAVVERINLLADCSDEIIARKTPAAQLLARGLCDPVRLFVKNEPHTKKKRAERRWRLISLVALVDQFIERLLCSGQNNAEIFRWRDIPSKPGIGLTDDATLAEFAADIFKKTDPIGACESDCQGFDWSVQDWELMADAEMRVRLCSGSPRFRKILFARVYCLSNSVFALSDGRLYDTEAGVQKSGSYNTSSTNSRMRALANILVGGDFSACMGDDCVEDYVPDAEAKYKSICGKNIKDKFVPNLTTFAFCSTQFNRHGSLGPVDGSKMFFRLIEQAVVTEEFIAQFSLEMRHHRLLSRYVQYARTLLPQPGNTTVEIVATEGKLDTSRKVTSKMARKRANKMAEKAKKFAHLTTNLVQSIQGSIKAKPKAHSAPTSYGFHTKTAKPKITNVDGGITVQHREFVADILSDGIFAAVTAPLVPTNIGMFRWLPNVATNYSQYRFKKFTLEYVPSCSVVVSGTVIINFLYDLTSTLLSDKPTFMSVEGATRCVPWDSMTNSLNTKSANVMTRRQVPPVGDYTYTSGAASLPPGADATLYFAALVNYATDAPTASLGEMYVSYEVELFNPLPDAANAGIEEVQSLTDVGATNMFGNAQTYLEGDFGVRADNQTLSFEGCPPGTYIISGLMTGPGGTGFALDQSFTSVCGSPNIMCTQLSGPNILVDTNNGSFDLSVLLQHVGTVADVVVGLVDAGITDSTLWTATEMFIDFFAGVFGASGRLPPAWVPATIRRDRAKLAYASPALAARRARRVPLLKRSSLYVPTPQDLVDLQELKARRAEEAKARSDVLLTGPGVTPEVSLLFAKARAADDESQPGSAPLNGSAGSPPKTSALTLGLQRVASAASSLAPQLRR